MPHRHHEQASPDPGPAWEVLLTRAEKVIQQTIASLPPELKPEAEKLPCLLERWAAGGSDRDTLGEYIGFDPGCRSDCNGPIILYLRAIHEFSREEKTRFEDEVRRTYLHEFGHHLGWDEDDLEERGLE